MPTTPNRGYPYPDYADPANFPADHAALALAVDADMNALFVASDAAYDQPSARATRMANQAVATGVNVTLTYTAEAYDNDAIFDLGTSTSNMVIQTPGVYLVSGSITIGSDGAAGGAVALILSSTGALLANPFGMSRELDNDRETSLSYTTLHYVPTTPETLSQTVRHNHGASLNVTNAQFTVTRIA
jgi:hypothetical protein